MRPRLIDWFVAGLATTALGCAGPGTAPGGPPVPSQVPGVRVALPPAGGLDYQLGGTYDPPAGTTVVARDATATPAGDRYNICYVNGFQSQPGEADDWGDLLLRDPAGPVADPGWPDEYLLDTSTAANRTAIARRLGERIRGCARAGFDAVEFDNLDSYQRSAGTLTAGHNLALASLLVTLAHDVGLAAGHKNAPELAERGAALGFDFAVAESCGHYDECDAFEEVFPVVLDIEYGDAASFAALCRSGVLPPFTVRRDRDLAPPSSPGYVFERCP